MNKFSKSAVALLLVLSMMFTMCISVYADDEVVDSSEPTVELSDNFETLENWTSFGAKGFSVCDKGLFFNNMKEYINESKLIGGDASWMNYSINTTIIPSNGYFAGIYFRYKDEDTHYLLQFYFASKKIAILKKVNGGIYTTVAEKPYTFKYGNAINVSITTENENINVKLDDNDVLSTIDSGIIAGKIGFKGLRSVYYVKNIEVICAAEASPEQISGTSSLVNLGMPDHYNAIPATATTQERFELRKAELPDELNVIKPYEVKGKIEIFCSPKGNDKNDGSIEKPVKTINKALDLVAITPDRSEGAVIWLRDGTYENTDTLQINSRVSGLSADAPLFISAYNDEDVTIIGGYKLDNSQFESIKDKSILNRLDKTVRDKVYVLDLKKAGVKNVPEIKGSFKGATLYMDGENCDIARYPNFTYAKVEKVLDTGPVTSQGEANDGRGFRIGFVKDGEPLTWQNTGEIMVRGGFYYEWNQVYAKININKEEVGFDSLGTASKYGVRTNSDFFYYNVLEELNFPGEYFIDRKDMKLYLYPIGEIKDSSKIYLSVLDKGKGLLQITDAQNIIFNNISFEAGSNTAATVTTSNSIIFQRCNFQNFGDNELFLNKSTKCGATCCTFSKFGNRSMYSLPPDGAIDSVLPTNNFIQNCGIYGNKDQALNSMTSNNGVGDVISHNYYGNGYATGVGIASYEGVVEYNEICACPKYQRDSGGLYTGGEDGSKGVHVRYNFWHDAAPESTNTLTRSIYFDEMGSDSMAYGNIWYRFPAGYFSHGGRDHAVVNNIAITNNIAASNNGDAKDSFAIANSNNMFNASCNFKNRIGTNQTTIPEAKAARYPQYKIWNDNRNLLKIAYQQEGYTRGELEDEVRSPKNFYCANNISVMGGGKIEFTRTDPDIVQGLETNKVYTDYSFDPFVDSASENFNLKEDAQVFTDVPGFEKIDFDNMGLLISDDYMKTRPYLGQFGKIFPFSPANGESGVQKNTNVEFKWTDVTWSTTFLLEVATDPEFSDIIHSEETQFEYATLNLPDCVGKTLYWRVTAYTKGKSIDKTPLHSDVFSFTTMTEQELIEHSRINTVELAEIISSASDTANLCVDGTESGQYPIGTKANLSNIIAAAKKVLKNPSNQPQVEKTVSQVKNAVNQLRSKENYGYSDLPINASGWTGPATNQFYMGNDDGTGDLTIQALNGTQNAQIVGVPKYRQIYRFQMKIDTLSQWWGMTLYWDPVVRERYFFVMKPDVIEMQISRADGTNLGVVKSVQNNLEVMKSDTWQEIELGSVLLDDDHVWLYMKVDDKVLFDYIDDNLNKCLGTLQFMLNPANGAVHLKKTAKTDNTPPELPIIP